MKLPISQSGRRQEMELVAGSCCPMKALLVLFFSFSFPCLELAAPSLPLRTKASNHFLFSFSCRWLMSGWNLGVHLLHSQVLFFFFLGGGALRVSPERWPSLPSPFLWASCRGEWEFGVTSRQQLGRFPPFKALLCLTGYKGLCRILLGGNAACESVATSTETRTPEFI